MKVKRIGLMALVIIQCLVFVWGAAYADVQQDIMDSDKPLKSAAPLKTQDTLDISGASGVIRSAGSDKGSAGQSSGLSLPKTTDKVEINDDGTISVTVADGPTVSVLPPFGWLMFTQDMLAQLDLYSQFVSDGPELVASMQADGISGILMDLENGYITYMSVSEDVLSSIVEDADLLDDDMLEMVLGAAQNVYTDTVMSVEKINGHVYFVYDYRPSGYELLIYSALKGNRAVDFRVSCDGMTIPEDLIEAVEGMLMDVTYTY